MIPDVVQMVDDSALFVLVVTVLLLIGIIAFMLYCVFTYSRKKHPKAVQIEGHLGLEIAWTVLPTFLVMIMFYWGLIGFYGMRSVPKDAMIVKVHAWQWKWQFEYENGKKSDFLIVPEGRSVKCVIDSRDVLHSLFIPEYKIKEDAVPGLSTYLWFHAAKKGRFDIFCTEYCGVSHSSMITYVKVVDPGEFENWYNTGSTVNVKTVLKKGQCLTCHSTDGTKKIGPSFKGIFGKKEVVLTNKKERTVTIDAQYIRDSILTPSKDVVKGFPPAMPPKKLGEAELNAVIEYIKTLK